MFGLESSIHVVYDIYLDLLAPCLYCLVDWLIFSFSVACVVAFFGAIPLMTLILAAIAIDPVFYAVLWMARLLVK
jgi:hypothetical protein